MPISSVWCTISSATPGTMALPPAFLRVVQRALHKRDRRCLRCTHEGGLADHGITPERTQRISHAAQHPAGAAQVGTVAKQYQLGRMAAQDVAFQVGRDHDDAFGMAGFELPACAVDVRRLPDHARDAVRRACAAARGWSRCGLRPPPAPAGCRPPGAGRRLDRRTSTGSPHRPSPRSRSGRKHRHQGSPQAAPECAHASAPADRAAAGVRAKAIRRRPPMPPATPAISSNMANGPSETCSGEPMNCCWVCSSDVGAEGSS